MSEKCQKSIWYNGSVRTEELKAKDGSSAALSLFAFCQLVKRKIFEKGQAERSVMVFIMAHISKKEITSTPIPSKATRKPRDPSINQDTLNDQQTYVCEHITDILDDEFRRIKKESGLSSYELAAKLHPAILSEAVVSKILAFRGSDVRHVNFKIAAALRFRFGFSIDKMLDDALKNAPTED